VNGMDTACPHVRGEVREPEDTAAPEMAEGAARGPDDRIRGARQDNPWRRAPTTNTPNGGGDIIPGGWGGVASVERLCQPSRIMFRAYYTKRIKRHRTGGGPLGDAVLLIVPGPVIGGLGVKRRSSLPVFSLQTIY
ncbi:hypothetical protein AAFF_G00205730, partial [Aldrovandia affinis]